MIRSLLVLLPIALIFGCVHGDNKATLFPENQFYKITQHGSNTYSIKVKSGQFKHMGCNSGFITTENGVVIFDTHINEKAMKMVLADIKRLTDKPVIHVINSHFHGDHVQGNNAFGENTPIYLHANAKGTFGIADKTKRPKTAPEADVRAPNRWVEKDQTLSGTSLQLIALGPAHSRGDLALFNPTDKVLFLGDVLVNGYVGFLGEGHLKEWVHSLSKLANLNAKTVVPGHGAVSDNQSVVKYRDYINDFILTTRKHFDSGQTPESYKLPEKYKDLGARFFLKANIERAHQLWKNKKL